MVVKIGKYGRLCDRDRLLINLIKFVEWYKEEIMQTYYYEYRDDMKSGTVQANTDEEALALVRDKNLLVLYKESDSIDGRPYIIVKEW